LGRDRSGLLVSTAVAEFGAHLCKGGRNRKLAGAEFARRGRSGQARHRVAVIEKGGADLHLSRTLQNATLVRVSNVGELDAVLEAGKADAIAATKTPLFNRAASRPGPRVLDGRFLVEPIGMGVPKGRDTSAAAYVGNFVEEAWQGQDLPDRGPWR
jgi:polar amino acid transport system substrate-binding protein